MPAMARIAARGQHGAIEAFEFLEIAAGQLQAARVEPSQAAQLIDPDLRRHVGEIALSAREHNVDLTLGIALDAVKSILFEELRRARIGRSDGAAFDTRHVLVRMKTEHPQVAQAADQT